MKTKIGLILMGMLVLVGSVVYILDYNKPTETDCSKLTTAYLKPSEVAELGEKSQNTIYVVPAWNQVMAKTEVLQCPNFHYDDYINLNVNPTEDDALSVIDKGNVKDFIN